jgi:diacylglycerol kinase (ATP)
MRIKKMEKNTGLKRLIYASQYSWQGLKSGLANEAAFLQEFVAFVILTVLTFFLDITAIEQVAMIVSLILVLIVEILNSAIECVVDRVSTERHILSGRAKDYGSLAVLMAIIIVILIWSVILF